MAEPHTHADPESPAMEIPREEIVDRRGDRWFTLVDVLPQSSYEEGHIPGAISLPLSVIPERAAAVLPDLSRDIAVYCGSYT